MRFDRAICVGVDRVAGKCLVQFPIPAGSDEQPFVLPVRYRGDPPAPLTYVEMTEVVSGSWVCKGSLANVETRLIEDWDQVQSDTASTPFVYGSTAWGVSSSIGATSYAHFTDAAAEYGSIRIDSSATSGKYNGIYKTGGAYPASDADRGIAWWLEAKCLVEESTSRLFSVGFDFAGADPFASAFGVRVVADTATLSDQLRLRCSDTTSTEANMGFTPTADVPFIVHIMLMGTQWAAAWVVESSTAAQDLDTTVHGPFPVTADIPGPSPGSPSIFVKNSAAATKNIQCDYFRVSTVHPVVHPNEVLSVTG